MVEHVTGTDEMLSSVFKLVAERDALSAENARIKAEVQRLEKARDDARANAVKGYQHLSNLLARIHRDGGHYEAYHGTAKAVVDADRIVAELYAAEVSPAALTPQDAGEAVAWHDMQSAPTDGTRFLARQGDRYFDCWWHDAGYGEAYWMDQSDSEPSPTKWTPLPLVAHPAPPVGEPTEGEVDAAAKCIDPEMWSDDADNFLDAWERKPHDRERLWAFVDKHGQLAVGSRRQKARETARAALLASRKGRAGE